MSHTEEQASRLWCPMVRHKAGWNGHHADVDRSGSNYQYKCNCIADGCAMWRWNEMLMSISFTADSVENLRTGYCGLAGKPL